MMMIQVVCGKGATAVIAPDGRMMVAGDNSHNRLGLDTDNIDTFTPVLTHLPPIRDISISGHFGVDTNLEEQFHMNNFFQPGCPLH